MQKKYFTKLPVSILVAGLTLLLPVQAAPYDLIDLGTLGGDVNFSFAINNLDQITGSSNGAEIPEDQIDENNPAASCPGTAGVVIKREFCNRGYLYSAGLLTDIGDLGSFNSFGFGINDNATIVGYSQQPIEDDDEDPTNNPLRDRAIISFAGGLVEALPFPAQSNNLPETMTAQQRALDISNARQIVGYAMIQLENEDGVEDQQNRPFLYDYDTDTYTILPLFSAENNRTGTARAINSSGMIVGWATSEEENFPIHGFLWDPATPEQSIDLGTLGGYSSDARDINDNGIIIGRSETSKERALNNNLGYIYDPAATPKMSAIPEFSDADNFNSSTAYAINNNNQIVGSAQISGGFGSKSTAFLYDHNNGTLVNLNDMVDCSLGWVVSLARDINDNGIITGTGSVNGEVRSFMLIPTTDTEPTNCTELRLKELQQRRNEANSAAGSFGILSLILGTFLLSMRRYKSHMLG